MTRTEYFLIENVFFGLGRSQSISFSSPSPVTSLSHSKTSPSFNRSNSLTLSGPERTIGQSYIHTYIKHNIFNNIAGSFGTEMLSWIWYLLRWQVLCIRMCMYVCMYIPVCKHVCVNWSGGFRVDRSVHVCVCGRAHGVSGWRGQVHHALRVSAIQVQTRSG